MAEDGALAVERLAQGIDHAPHAQLPAGAVIWQDPPPGLRAQEGTRVLLVTSAGAARIPVPDVAGYDVDLARSLMRAAASITAPTILS